MKGEKRKKECGIQVADSFIPNTLYKYKFLNSLATTTTSKFMKYFSGI